MENQRRKVNLNLFQEFLLELKNILCLLYTRKRELGSIFHNPDAQIITKAKEWFGDANVKNID